MLVLAFLSALPLIYVNIFLRLYLRRIYQAEKGSERRMLSWLKQSVISQADFTSTHVMGVDLPSQTAFFFTVTSVVVELQHSNMAMCISAQSV